MVWRKAVTMTFPEVLERLLGLHTPPSDLTVSNMALRAVVVFVFGVALFRIADRRFLGRSAGFDILLAVVLGSLLSRGINGQAAFLPTLAACTVLVLLHRLAGSVAYRFHRFSQFMKGHTHLLVRDGEIDRVELGRTKISQDDLEENLRLNGNVARAVDVAEARLERNGRVSVIRRRLSH